eukprot:m.104403 g.104403  ORF g.104403 m.104403 type:complete len:51 (-) comp15242_c0_seq1:401-553(-)
MIICQGVAASVPDDVTDMRTVGTVTVVNKKDWSGVVCQWTGKSFAYTCGL